MHVNDRPDVIATAPSKNHSVLCGTEQAPAAKEKPSGKNSAKARLRLTYIYIYTHYISSLSSEYTFCVKDISSSNVF